MKRSIVLLFFMLMAFGATAQNITVKSFRLLEMDMTASSLEGKRTDQNGRVAALIKIVTSEKGFTFEGGALGIVGSQQRNGEIWVWVPYGLRKITILHQQLGVLRDYRFPIEIESERTYEMVLVTGTVETIVKEQVHEQYLMFQITPPEAVLEVDDQMWTVSSSGVASKFVNFGTYSYRVQASNYHPDAGKVTVNDPDNTVQVTINLLPNFGWIEVPGNGLLQGATVYVDNAIIGKAPCKSGQLKSGQHNVRIVKELYEPYTAVVTVSDNETTTVSPNLTADFAHITLQVDADAEIWVNDEQKGTRSWSGNLSTGVYKIECKRANHESTLTTKEITNQMDGETIVLTAPKPIYGSLMVESEPAMATIYIDGKEVGQTPKIINEILIGEHSLLLTKDNHNNYTETVTIVKGERKQVRATLAKAEFYAKGKAFYDKNEYTQAFRLFTEGANAGDVESQVMLGRMYYKGKGTEQDCEQARRWFQAAIDQNNADAYAWMSDIYVEKKCGDEVDYEKALQLIRKSIDLGSAYGMNNLGWMYQNGFGITKDLNEAVKWYRMSAEHGDPVGQLDLGGLYSSGKGVTQDYAEAMKWYRMAADQGHAEGFSAIANMYYNGKGVAQDYAEAMKWYKKADEKGLTWAKYYVGLCYEKGYNNAQEAAKWYRLAAEDGNSTAQNAIGMCYQHGNGVKQDYNEAVKWYRRAIDKGNTTAQNQLGWCYLHGYGVTKDEKEALKWFRLSADKGNMYGLNNVGYCYDMGYGVEKNAQEAFRWYKLSAEKGYSVAQNNLGNCYKNGYGVAKDLNEARKWYQKAADQGYEQAKENLKNLK